jgi:hypothetical protein
MTTAKANDEGASVINHNDSRINRFMLKQRSNQPSNSTSR